MSVEIKVSDLKPILLKAIHAVPKKVTSLPVLSCFRLYFRKDSIVIEATDLRCRFISRCPAQGDLGQDIEVAIPAAGFCKYIETLQETDIIKLDIDGATLKLKRGRSLARFNMMDPNGFPPAPRISTEEIPQKIAFADFKTLMKRAIPFTSDNDTRPALQGVCLVDGKNIYATNGHHAVMIDDPKVLFRAYGYGTIITTECLEILFKSFKADDILEIMPTENYCYFKSKDVLLGVSTTDFSKEAPAYPDVGRLLPPPGDICHSGRIKTKEIILAIKRMLVLTKNAKRHYYIVKFVDNFVELRFPGEDGLGEVIEVVEGAFFSSDFDVALSPVYLLTYLESLEEEEVDIGLCGALKPVLFKTDGRVYVIMPIKVTRT